MTTRYGLFMCCNQCNIIYVVHGKIIFQRKKKKAQIKKEKINEDR